MPDGPETSRACVARLQARLDESLAPLLGDGPVALVDYPDHANVGDSAIWLGETTYLRRRGLTPVYVSTIRAHDRSEEHTSELQSLMRISYAVFCLKKKK